MLTNNISSISALEDLKGGMDIHIKFVRISGNMKKTLLCRQRPEENNSGRIAEDDACFCSRDDHINVPAGREITAL